MSRLMVTGGDWFPRRVRPVEGRLDRRSDARRSPDFLADVAGGGTQPCQRLWALPAGTAPAGGSTATAADHCAGCLPEQDTERVMICFAYWGFRARRLQW